MTMSGMGDLKRKFRALGEIGQGKALFRVGVAGMLIIINDAKRRAAYLTGTLRRSLHVGGAAGETPDFDGGLGTGYKDLGAGDISATRAEIFGGTDVPYGARIEFGYEDSDSLGRSYHQKAQPYLRPAFDTKGQAAIEEMRKAFVLLIEKAAER